MNDLGGAALAIVGGVITLAIVSVLVSRNAQTGSVISSAGGALSSVIGAAVAPVSGTGGILGNIGLNNQTLPLF